MTGVAAAKGRCLSAQSHQALIGAQATLLNCQARQSCTWRMTSTSSPTVVAVCSDQLPPTTTQQCRRQKLPCCGPACVEQSPILLASAHQLRWCPDATMLSQTNRTTLKAVCCKQKPTLGVINLLPPNCRQHATVDVPWRKKQKNWQRLQFRCRGGATGTALDLRSSTGRGFKSYSGQSCVTALGKLFTPMCLCHQAL